MKKYSKPEIVTLALDMIDVIETSAVGYAANALATDKDVDARNIAMIEAQVTQMNDDWSW